MMMNLNVFRVGMKHRFLCYSNSTLTVHDYMTEQSKLQVTPMGNIKP